MTAAQQKLIDAQMKNLQRAYDALVAVEHAWGDEYEAVATDAPFAHLYNQLDSVQNALHNFQRRCETSRAASPAAGGR